MYQRYPCVSTSLYALTAILIAFAWAPAQIHAQDQNRNQSQRLISCSSDGGRVFCDADTRGGVRLIRQYQSSGHCAEGSTWGYTDRAIWVDRGCSGAFALGSSESGGVNQTTRIERGAMILLRTSENIDTNKSGGRTYSAVIDRDVLGPNGQVVISRDAHAELAVRAASDNELVLDLQSVTVKGQRQPLQDADMAAEQIIARGQEIKIPSGSLLTFRVKRELDFGSAKPSSQ